MLERSLCSIGEIFFSIPPYPTRSVLGVDTKHVFQGSVGIFYLPHSQVLMTQKEKEPSIHMHIMYAGLSSEQWASGVCVGGL